MLFFILGIISGFILSIFIICILIYFKSPIQKNVTIIEKRISDKGPKPKAIIVMPDDEADEFREELIKENKKKGLDTPIADLL